MKQVKSNMTKDFTVKRGLRAYADGGLVGNAAAGLRNRQAQIDAAVNGGPAPVPTAPPPAIARVPTAPAPATAAPAPTEPVKAPPRVLGVPVGGPVGDVLRKLGMRHGGHVRGPGGPMDDMVPAKGPGGSHIRLSNGEYVLPKKTVDAMGGPEELDELVRHTTGREPGPERIDGVAHAVTGGEIWDAAKDYAGKARDLGARGLRAAGDFVATKAPAVQQMAQDAYQAAAPAVQQGVDAAKAAGQRTFAAAQPYVEQGLDAGRNVVRNAGNFYQQTVRPAVGPALGAVQGAAESIPGIAPSTSGIHVNPASMDDFVAARQQPTMYVGSDGRAELRSRPPGYGPNGPLKSPAPDLDATARQYGKDIKAGRVPPAGTSVPPSGAGVPPTPPPAAAAASAPQPRPGMVARTATAGGRLAGTATRLATSPAAVGMSAMSGFNDLEAVDSATGKPIDDSVAGLFKDDGVGTGKKLLAGLGRTAAEGAGGIAGTVDAVAGLFGAKPNLQGKVYDYLTDPSADAFGMGLRRNSTDFSGVQAGHSTYQAAPTRPPMVSDPTVTRIGTPGRGPTFYTNDPDPQSALRRTQAMPGSGRIAIDNGYDLGLANERQARANAIVQSMIDSQRGTPSDSSPTEWRDAFGQTQAERAQSMERGQLIDALSRGGPMLASQRAALVAQMHDMTERRGQDMTSSTLRRGQDFNYDLGLRGNAATLRGQDMHYDLGLRGDQTARRGQDYNYAGHVMQNNMARARMNYDMTQGADKALTDHLTARYGINDKSTPEQRQRMATVRDRILNTLNANGVPPTVLADPRILNEAMYRSEQAELSDENAKGFVNWARGLAEPGYDRPRTSRHLGDYQPQSLQEGAVVDYLRTPRGTVSASEGVYGPDSGWFPRLNPNALPRQEGAVELNRLRNLNKDK